MTGSPSTPQQQEPSHSAGHTRLVNSGKKLVCDRMLNAARQSPAAAAALKSGT